MVQKIVVFCVVILITAAPAFAVPTLHSGAATMTSSTVSFPLSLTNSSGASITGITADIIFNSGEVALVMNGANPISATVGEAATAVGKQLNQSNPAEGVLHIVIIDLAGITAIADGTVAQISFSLITGDASGNYTFTIVPTATDAQGNSVTITGGKLTVPIPATPVNGTCGTANGQTFSFVPATNLCTTGKASVLIGTDPWNWSCAGFNNGTNANCTAAYTPPKPINGVCGSANWQAFYVAPTANYCTIGTATVLTGSGPWNWGCNGLYNGTNASCTAVKLIPKPGDCDLNGTVDIAEVQSAINMFLGLKMPTGCVDLDGNGSVTISEVQKVINSFLGLESSKGVSP